MREPNDWRLTNQLSYFRGATLRWQAYRRYREDWDHDHCEFCGTKFAEPDAPGTLHEGYTTTDNRRWVCRACFDDFADLFAWLVVADSAV